MSREIDEQTTRRRIEDALRKTTNHDMLEQVAYLLNVKVAYDPLADVSDIEKKLTAILNADMGKTQEELHNELVDILPFRFKTYFISFGKPPDRWSRAYCRDFFTREAAEDYLKKKYPSGSGYFIQETKQRLLALPYLMREAGKSNIPLQPDEIEVLKKL